MLMRFAKGFGQFWYDFLIGDDWKIAAAVVSTLVAGALVLVTTDIPERVFTMGLGVAVMVTWVLALKIDTRAADAKQRTHQ